MSDVQLLFAVLGALYAWECACWVPRGSVAFVTWLGRRWRAAHPGAVLGNQRGGLIFTPPLPPLGAMLIGSQFLLSLSPEAALAFVASSVNPGSRPIQTGEFLPWDTIRTVEASGRKVRVNGRVLLKAASPTLAAHLAGQLQRLRQSSPASRASAIQRIIRDALDTEAIRKRWGEFQRQTAGMRLLANLLAGFVFVAAPLLIWQFGFGRCWLGLLAGVLALTTATATLFHRAHKTLYPAAQDERLAHFLTVLLAPATAMRALDILSRPLLETFHPLAIARVFCPDPQFRDFARDIWRELCHPALPVCPAAEPRAEAVERHFRAALQDCVAELLRQSGISPQALAAPPAPADPTCRSYCPRCLAQFTAGQRVCPDCGGQPLRPLAGCEEP